MITPEDFKKRDEVLKLFIKKSMGFRLNQLDTLSELSLNEDILRAFGESSLAESIGAYPTEAEHARVVELQGPSAISPELLDVHLVILATGGFATLLLSLRLGTDRAPGVTTRKRKPENHEREFWTCASTSGTNRCNFFERRAMCR